MNATEVIDRVEHPHSWCEIGEGRAVVFLHGLGGSRTAWGPQLRSLGGTFRCIAWDMPGYGAAEPVESLTFPVIADRLVALLDHLDLETVDLVGLSFGGMHALHTALRHPDRVGRMVLADTSPAFGLDGTTAADWTAARLDPLDGGLTPADVAPAVITAITAGPLDGEIEREVVDAFGRISSDGLRAAVHCLPTHDVRDRLGEIAQPSLVVVGELDDETPPSYARALADGLVDAEFVVIDDVGHLTPSEAPDEFNRLVLTFLTEGGNA